MWRLGSGILGMRDEEFMQFPTPNAYFRALAEPAKIDVKSLPLGPRPNDPTKPILLSPEDDGFATEMTGTFELDGRWVLLPTIVNGQKVSGEDAIRAFYAGENPEAGVFETREEADAYAKLRSKEEGKRYPEELKLRKSGNIPTPEERAKRWNPQPWVPKANIKDNQKR